MDKDSRECNFTGLVGLQAAEVGAMLLGSFVEAEVGSVKARTSQQGRAGHVQRSCWENGEFSLWAATARARAGLWKAKAWFVPAPNQRAFVSSSNLQILIQWEVCTLLCLLLYFQFTFIWTKFWYPLPLNLNYYIFKNMLTNLRFWNINNIWPKIC